MAEMRICYSSTINDYPLYLGGEMSIVLYEHMLWLLDPSIMYQIPQQLA